MKRLVTLKVVVVCFLIICDFELKAQMQNMAIASNIFNQQPDSLNVDSINAIQTEVIPNKGNLSGYLEIYYGYDFSNPDNHTRPSFVYSHNRHNEVSLNLGLIKYNYTNNLVRSNFALMAGTYANANLAAEPGVLKNIYEANVGVKISKKNEIWVDAGIMPSHIGFESAISKDCWNLTRSLLAENSPYYESGVKISYTNKNQKLFLSGLLLNGWQRMQRVNGNNVPAFGHQLTYKPNDKITLNSSSFIGSDLPDSLKTIRYFHNFYGWFKLNPKLELMVGFDIGANHKNSDTMFTQIWYSPVLIAKIPVTKNMTIAARAEYYSDKNEVIIATGTANGFQTFGYSVNLDYLIADLMLWRMEVRGLQSKDSIFYAEDKLVNTNYFITSSLAISF